MLFVPQQMVFQHGGNGHSANRISVSLKWLLSLLGTVIVVCVGATWAMCSVIHSNREEVLGIHANSYKEKVEEVAKERDLVKASNTTLTEARDHANEKIGELKGDILKADGRAERAETEATWTRQERDHMKTLGAEKDVAITNLSKERDGANEKIGKLSGDVLQAIGRAERAETDAVGLRQKRDDLTVANSKMEADIAVLTKERNDARTATADATKQYVDATKQYDDLLNRTLTMVLFETKDYRGHTVTKQFKLKDAVDGTISVPDIEGIPSDQSPGWKFGDDDKPRSAQITIR